MPSCVWSMMFCTSVFLVVIICVIDSFVFSFDNKSLIPTLNAVDFKYSVIMFCKSSMKLDDAKLLKSLQMRWIIPFEFPPNTLLSICPRIYFPFFISRIALDVFLSSVPSLNALVLYFNDMGGKI